MGSGYELAKAVESLASDHGGRAAVLKLTPRTISALLQLKERRGMASRAELARLIRVASAGDEKVFARMVRKLEEEGQ